MGQKEIITDNLTMAKAPSSSSSRQLRERQNFQELEANIALSSKQSAYHRSTSWGDWLWIPTPSSPLVNDSERRNTDKLELGLHIISTQE